MSSSRQQSNNLNNNNSAYQNQLSDYEIDDESLNSQRYPQQTPYVMNGIVSNDMAQPYANGLFQQMYPFQEDLEEDLPSEIVAELDARAAQIQSDNNNDDDDAVFSDVVQDAFKKYQNEYSKYWTHDDTTWSNSLSEEEIFDNEQEELYAQMEECWNYMTQENTRVDMPKNVEPSQPTKLNPDAVEFQPTWLKSSPTSINEESIITLTPSQLEEQQKKL